MTDDEIKREYARVFDNIHANDDLKERVLKLQNKKRNPKPFIASVATVAAGIMIFAAVHNVALDRSGNDDVISETVTTADGTKPVNTPSAVYGDGGVISSENTTPDNNSQPQNTADNITSNADKSANKAAQSSGTGSASSSSSTGKTNEQIEKEAIAKANSVYEKAESGTRQDTGSSYTHNSSENSSVNTESSIPDNSKEYNLQSNNVSGNSADDIYAKSDDSEKAHEDNSAQNSSASEVRASGGGSANSSASGYGGYNNPLTAQYGVSAVREQDEAGYVVWDNNRYFNYIGKDIISCIESVRGFVYTGDDSAYFSIDEHGSIEDYTRVFEFSNGTDTVRVTSSTDTASAEKYMNDDRFSIVTVNGNQAAILSADGMYKCYMTADGVFYKIEVYTSDDSVLEEVLMSL